MQDKTVIFEAFAKKAAARLEERKKQRTEWLKIQSIDDQIQIRGLSDAELQDCFDFSENAIDVDEYTIYMASPTLQEAAKLLKAEGTIQQEYKITEMFTMSERNYIAKRVLVLSGMDGQANVEVIKEHEEIKNS